MPVRLRLGRPRTTLVIAPHADDETIGAWALIRTLRLLGRQVRVLVVTDGAASHPASRRWPRPRLVAERHRETRGAMRLLGVYAGDIAFLDLPDGGMRTITARQKRLIARKIRQTRDLDLVVSPSLDDDHPDHRVVATAVQGAARGRRRLAYLVWPDRQAARRRPYRTLPFSAALAKRGAILRYRTQTGAITDDPGGFTISRRELARFARPVERYEASSW